MLAREIAVQANASKSRFLAPASHEIRTPMTAMLSRTQLAINQVSDDAQRETLGKAQDAGRLLLGIINDLLDLSRKEQGDFQLVA